MIADPKNVLTGVLMPGLVLVLAAAGTAAAEPMILPQVVVTATATEQDLRDAPASITVIDGEDLRTRPVQDLADALRGAPSVHLSHVGFGRRGVSIRGMPTEHTLVLVDGMRVNAANNAIAHADFDLGWIPVEAIERIEVVRGPMSSLYGSDALGGVVNVITRRATDAWSGSARIDVGRTVHDRGGHTAQAGAYGGGPLIPGVLGLNLWIEGRKRDPLRQASDPALTSQEGLRARSGTVGLTWTPDEAQRIDLRVGAGYEERSRDRPRGGAGSLPFRAEDELRRLHLSLSHEGDWSWGASKLRLYRATLDRDAWRSDRLVQAAPQRLVDNIADGHVSLPAWERHLFTIGGEVRQEKLEDEALTVTGAAEAVHKAVFIQDDIALTPDLSLVLGSRFDHHPDFGWHASPRAYAVWHWNPSLTLKGGVGRGFKAPTLKQLSPEFETVGGGGRFVIVGTPTLQPETNTAYELGAEYVPGPWSVRAMLFQNDVSGLIQTRCVASCGVRGSERRIYENVDSARLRGLELGAGFDLPWELRLDGNYTWLSARDLTNNRTLAERPRHQAAATLAWRPLDAVSTFVRAEYVGEQVVYQSNLPVDLAPYTLWSVGVAYDLTETVTLRAGVDNLTDQKLADQDPNYSYANAGRMVHAGLSVRF